MLLVARQRTMRGLALSLAAVLAALGLLALASPSAQAAQSGWGQFTLTGSSRNYAGTLTQQAAGFPQATVTSNSIGGGVGVQSGASTWLSTATDVGAKYGSSRNQGYLNLRPYNQNGAPPSVTTYTFERPTPSAGWTFVLGDVDADQVTVTATGPGGRTVAPSELGFRSVFNYCTPGVCTANTDVPSWNPATGVLLGNTQALDTNGASAWFEPTVPLTSLTFTFAQRAGFPVYQTWFSALEYDITGTVTAPPGEQDGITVVLYDPAGNQVGRTTTDTDGAYRFPGYATYDGYRVQVVRPTGLTSDDPLTQVVDLSDGDQVADFTLRAIVPVPVSGAVTDPDGRPVAGVTVTLTPPGGGTTRTTVTESDGTYVFEDVAVGDGYTLTATAPPGTSVSAPLSFDVPPDSETPITDRDFVVTPIPTGTASGTVREGSGSGPGLSGVRIDISGPEGATYSAVTDDDGNWTLPGLPPGDYTATVVALDGTEIVGDGDVAFTIGADGSDADDVDFVLAIAEPATFSAGGRVTDDDGQPIAGVRVTLTDPTTGTTRDATTNAQGYWTLDDLDPASGYTATVTVPDGYDPVGDTTRTFTISDADVTGQDFVLQQEAAPTGTVSGAVTKDGSGAPVSGVTIRLTGPGGSTYTATTGTDGSWQVQDLPPGAYTATVVAPDGTEVVGDASRTFTIDDEGGAVTDQDFVLADVATFSAGGTVTDDSGSPLAGIEVVVTDPSDSFEQSVVTDDNGAWTAEGVPPDTGYTAEVTVPEGYRAVGGATLTFAVADTDVTGLDFTLAAVDDSSSGSGSGSGSSSGSGSGSSGSLASTGGPSLLIGLGGVALLIAGLLALAGRRRGRRS